MALVNLCVSDTCFFPRPELQQHLALYTLHKTPKERASPSAAAEHDHLIRAL